jgi:pyruvate kinase
MAHPAILVPHILTDEPYWGFAMLRRTRIVATLGPATDRPGILEAILEAGVDVVRINFSHGTADDHRRRIERVRLTAKELSRPVAVLADLPGPKLRVLLAAPMELRAGQEVSLAADPAASADLRVTEPDVISAVQPTQRVLLDDGRLQLRTVRREGSRLHLRVEAGGTLQPGKGFNLPDTPLSLPALTQRDRAALALAAEMAVDWLALSFVRNAEAASELREATRGLGLEVPILAKIERPEAIVQARDIIAAFDAIMVARGDLGVEIPLERVPHVQKRLIRQSRAAGKPVVTATDMLDSMRANPRPTRAEASDVANAVYDGTDAVMLSGETAVGQYPFEAVSCMDRIVRDAESHLTDDGGQDVIVPRGDIDDHLTHITCALAREIRADAIVAPTYSGRTARLIARHRPHALIVAPAPYERVVRQLGLVWGLAPVLMEKKPAPGEDRLEDAIRAAFNQGVVRAGQLLVVMAGHPIEGRERFPTLRVVRVGESGQSHSPLG